MYWLMSLDAMIRIALALGFLFVIVPALAHPRPRTSTALEWFFWNLGVGMALLTLAGQILTLVNIFSIVTLLACIAFVVLLGRAYLLGDSPLRLLRRTFETLFLAILNVVDRRVNVPRRIRRRYRRTVALLRTRTQSTLTRLQITGWILLAVLAAGFRFYRPLASANLGFSDTYVHLYLLKLLQEGQQVDPEWGPYPRGMHFLLLAIHQLTNVDEILLMNYFGAFAGILITLSIADATRRLSGSLVVGLLAGLLFATFVGGPRQYFILGGAFSATDSAQVQQISRLSYGEVMANAGEFDLALIAFHRQTSTLAQELAMALLFPGALFLLQYLRTRSAWQLMGYAGCTAAIAAVHSGVLIPLALMSVAAVIARGVSGWWAAGALRRAIVTAVISVMVGSAWMLAFIAYPYAGGRSEAGLQTSLATTALYYFPFLRPVAERDPAVAGVEQPQFFVQWTPLMVGALIAALVTLVLAFWCPPERRANLIWASLVFAGFSLIHFASHLGLPQPVGVQRNSQWLAMSLLVSLGVLVGEAAARARPLLPSLRAAQISAATGGLVLIILWATTVPAMTSTMIHDRIVNYSGYGGSALAVLRIERNFEPYTWTLISYGQEFPMVLRRGFHLPAADFLARYDPSAPVTPIPTPHLFLLVEKTPHRFQIDSWSQRFSRRDVEERLQTWIHVYQATHRNLRLFFEDENVRVYQIERSSDEIARLSAQVQG